MKKVLFILLFAQCGLAGCKRDVNNVTMENAPIAQSTNSNFNENLDLMIESTDGNFACYPSQVYDAAFRGHIDTLLYDGMYLDEDYKDEINNLELLSNLEFTGTGLIESVIYSNFMQISDSAFSFEIEVNGFSQEYRIISTNLNAENFESSLISYYSPEKTQACPPCIYAAVVAGYILIKETYERLSCTEIVKTAIMACRDMNMCFETGPCSVKCYICGL